MSEQQLDAPFWEQMGLPAPGSSLSREAYHALPQTSIHIEWHDGIVIYPNWSDTTMSPAPCTTHQRTVFRIATLLDQLTDDGDVLIAPTDVVIEPGKTIQPDVFWIAADGACVDRDTYFEGVPDLIVEVLSPGSLKHDRVTKFALYERCGVAEYWIVDPDARFIEAYHLRDDKYVRVSGATDFTSPVLGKTVQINTIFG